MGMKNDEPKRPPKSILYYYGIVLIVLLLLNVLVFPSLTERQVTEVTYDQFLDMLDQGIVEGVNRTDDQITFWTETELPTDSAQGSGSMFDLIEQMQMRAENVQLFKTGSGFAESSAGRKCYIYRADSYKGIAPAEYIV